MDPFEARLHFKQMLETMSSSSQTLQKAVAFAVKHQESHEDFHSVVLEILDHLDVNSRINVLYFLEALIRLVCSGKEQPRPYCHNLERDWRLILEKVIGNNLINLNSCVDVQRSVETTFDKKNKDLSLIYDQLTVDNPGAKVDEKEGFRGAWALLISKKRQGIRDRIKLIHDPSQIVGKEELSKDQLLQRVENDRERNKRLKETNWVVVRPSGKLEIAEFDKVWDEFDVLDEDDYRQLKELQQIARESYQV